MNKNRYIKSLEIRTNLLEKALIKIYLMWNGGDTIPSQAARIAQYSLQKNREIKEKEK